MSKFQYLLAFIVGMFLISCDKDQGTKNTMPTKLSVDIPDNISAASTTRSVIDNQSDYDGKETYELIKTFIAIAEHSAEVVEDLAGSLHEHQIDAAMDFEFNGDDGRKKHLVVLENQTVDGETWDLKLTLTDKEFNDTAIQVIWNKDEARGIAILHPYYMNNYDSSDIAARYRVDYSELEEGYDARMIVDINLTPDASDQWGIDNMKLFAGKTGDEFVLYGNSNHPNVSGLLADLSAGNGLNYAFIAKSDEANDIAVAEVALPPSTLVSTEDMMERYAAGMVLKKALAGLWHDEHPLIDTTDYTETEWQTLYDLIDGEVPNLDAPAYFDTDGFVSSGTDLPAGFTSDFVDFKNYSPYSPESIKTLKVKFE